jgi:hypothetical protein
MKTRAKTADLIKEFFSSSHYAVVGASNEPTKYGNKVLKWYFQICLSFFIHSCKKNYLN